MSSSKPFRVGLVGFGNIGTGFVRHVISYRDLLARRIEGGIELAAIADRYLDRERDVNPPPETRMTTDWKDITGDPTIDAVVELVGVDREDGRPNTAREIAIAALSNGKHFVTANKGLIATHGAELHTLAEKSGALVLYEATVGAGIPIITSLQGALAANRIVSIHGILNGTCNYILTRMAEEPELTLHQAIEEAQRLGYAEPDPRSDIEGEDAAYKLVILGSLAFGQELRVSHVRVEGITRLTEKEFDFARQNGYSLNLLASAYTEANDEVCLHVSPVFLPWSHILASVSNVFNAMLVTGDPMGETMYYGAGAGQFSTASGLLADLIVASRQRKHPDYKPHCFKIPQGGARLIPSEKIIQPHYLRLDLAGRPDLEQEVIRMMPGKLVSSTSSSVSFLLDPISELELERLLQHAERLGVHPEAICHVRFAFTSGKESSE